MQSGRTGGEQERRAAAPAAAQGTQRRGAPPPKGPPLPSGTCSIVPLGISFPPVQSSKVPGRKQSQIEFTVDCLRDLGLSRIRFSENWKHRESRKGSFDWAPLDSKIEYLQKNGISYLLTVQSDGPGWACGKRNENSCVFKDLEAFRRYVTRLFEHHAGRLPKVQFGNEMLSPDFFAGAPDDFLRATNAFYDAVKKVSPSTEVVLGGFSTGAVRRLAVCRDGADIPIAHKGKWVDASLRARFCQQDWVRRENASFEKLLRDAHYDTLDLHFYDDAEYWHLMYAAVRKLQPGKPVLVSEFGGPNLAYEPYTDAYHADRVRLYLRAISRLPGLREAYYFRLVEAKSSSKAHMKSSLFGPPPAIDRKPAYDAIKNYKAEACAR